MPDTHSDEAALLTIGDVARKMSVTVATVRNWESAGKITAVRTPGNQRRFRQSDVDALLSGGAQ